MQSNSQLKKLAVSAHISSAAKHWKEYIKNKGTSFVQVCIEEEVSKNSETRKLISSVPTSFGRLENTYELFLDRKEFSSYQFFLARAQECKAPGARFREDALGIWLL